MQTPPDAPMPAPAGATAPPADVAAERLAFDRDPPPFKAAQLKALVAHDEFEDIDWPGIFGVTPTPFRAAIDRTFNHPVYGRIVLEF